MIRLISFFMLMLLGFQLNSQIILEQEGKKAPLENMVLQVKQFDEFLNRFNYKQDFFGKKITESFKSQFPREKYINLLFHNQDSRLIEGSNEYSAAYLNLKDEFINTVVNGDGLYIDKYSEKIFAVAECRLTFKGKPAKATLILNQETAAGAVKWVIRKVDADFLNIKYTNEVTNFISPNSNETNFTELKRVLEKKEEFDDFSSRDYKYNQLSVFYYLVSKGEIKFEFVEKLKYLILDIDKWAIAVSFYNRDSDNSGWLISNISAVDEVLKEFLGL